MWRYTHRQLQRKGLAPQQPVSSLGKRSLLYAHLKQLQGACARHASFSSLGTRLPRRSRVIAARCRAAQCFALADELLLGLIHPARGSGSCVRTFAAAETRQTLCQRDTDAVGLRCGNGRRLRLADPAAAAQRVSTHCGD